MLVVCLVAALTSPATGAAQTEGDLFRVEAGSAVVDLLRRFEAEGLRLLWSSELVPAELLVVEPAVAEVREELLRLVLGPYGLTLEARGAALIVTSASPAAGSTKRLRGIVLSRATRLPVAEVRVRQSAAAASAPPETVTDRAGVFELTLSGDGPHSITVRRVGFVIIEELNLPTTPGAPGFAGALPLEILLEPAPLASETVDVQPSRITLFVDEPDAPFAFSRPEIEALPHLASDVVRALDLLPGIASNDLSAQFHVRGGRRDETLIEMDGQEIYDAYHLKDFDGALSLIPSSTLSAVTLSTGAYSVSHGDRMGGVLEMTTTAPATPRHFRLAASLLDLQAGASGRTRGGRAGWMLSLRPGSAKLAGAIFGEEDPDFWDAFAKSEITLTPAQTLTARMLWAEDRFTFREVRAEEERLFHTSYGSSYLWLTHQAIVSDRVLVETTGSYSRLERDRRGSEDEEEKVYRVDDRRDLDVEAISQTWDWQATPTQSWSSGFDLRRYVADYDYLSEREFFTPLSSLRAEPRDGRYDFTGQVVDETVGAHLFDRWRPSSNLSLEIGLRYDRHSATPESFWSPRASLAWAVGGGTVARVAWGRYVQGQRAYELGVEDGDTRLYGPESSENWVLGIDKSFGAESRLGLSGLRAEVYRRDVADPRPRYESLFEPLEPFHEGELDRVRLEPARGRARGVELLLHGRPLRRFQWWVNYSFARAEDRINGDWIPRQIDQRHALNVDIATRLGENWNLNLAWSYHSGRPSTAIFFDAVAVEDPVGESPGDPLDPDGTQSGEEESLALAGIGATEYLLRYGELNALRLAPYHRLDLRLSRDWTLRRGRLTFFTDVQNVYNRKNVAGFDVEFDEEIPGVIYREEPWPGLLASAGVAWEF